MAQRCSQPGVGPSLLYQTLTPAATKTASSKKQSKPPLVNPYDKLTEPEFEGFIDDVSLRIKLALGLVQVEERSEDEPDHEDVFGRLAWASI
jgi:hypothetical protein